jgi:hypothetical protein
MFKTGVGEMAEEVGKQWNKPSHICDQCTLYNGFLLANSLHLPSPCTSNTEHPTQDSLLSDLFLPSLSKCKLFSKAKMKKKIF